MVKNSIGVLCIVQARLTSTRLPDKVLMPLGSDNLSILEHVYNRLSVSSEIDKIVFAIPDAVSNDKLFDFLLKKNITVFRGNENDVLNRFYFCAKQYPSAIIVRATCDNPLVDWQIADDAISLLKESKADYILTKGFPLGASVEIMTFDALEKAYNNATTDSEHEHVTPYIYFHPDKFTINTLLNVENQSDYRFTVDTLEDYHFMRKVYDVLYQGTPLNNEDVIGFLEKNPEVRSINSMVKQKTI